MSEPKIQEKEIRIINIILLSQRVCGADSSPYPYIRGWECDIRRKDRYLCTYFYCTTSHPLQKFGGLDSCYNWSNNVQLLHVD